MGFFSKNHPKFHRGRNPLPLPCWHQSCSKMPEIAWNQEAVGPPHHRPHCGSPLHRGGRREQGILPGAGAMPGTHSRNSELTAGVGCPSPPATAVVVRQLGIHVCKPSQGSIVRETLFPLLRVEKQAAFSTDSLWFLIHKKKNFSSHLGGSIVNSFIKWLIYRTCGLCLWAFFITWKELLVIP